MNVFAEFYVDCTPTEPRRTPRAQRIFLFNSHAIDEIVAHHRSSIMASSHSADHAVQEGGFEEPVGRSGRPTACPAWRRRRTQTAPCAGSPPPCANRPPRRSRSAPQLAERIGAARAEVDHQDALVGDRARDEILNGVEPHEALRRLVGRVEPLTVMSPLAHLVAKASTLPLDVAVFAISPAWLVVPWYRPIPCCSASKNVPGEPRAGAPCALPRTESARASSAGRLAASTARRSPQVLPPCLGQRAAAATRERRYPIVDTFEWTDVQ